MTDSVLKPKTINDLAIFISKILKKDWYVFVVGDGNMGIGKSCFTTQLATAVSQNTNTPFDYEENMTYIRDDLKTFVDGKNGKGKLPEFSVILADEIVSMFFNRNWQDSEQIDTIELLNKCRDRHLCIMGNIPDFWQLDKALYPIISFRVHIPERGKAWVFMQDENPYTTDKWHRKFNEGIFAKYKNPYSCKGFVMEILFPDWTPADREKYYSVRNKKRVNTEGQREKKENFIQIKRQRNNLIKYMILEKKMKQKLIAKLTGMTQANISLIQNGIND